ncbi:MULTISPECIES: NAD(P)H-hydrate epimerase [unclassified Actinobaculum]|uniref:NAD(P)H-hydrate epimerase n=1 Tax=unclassified Actinobaculum TaxID=2609299 RepID=UPI000D52A4B9|nr:MULTISPECIES: NAD(P)H-hydrate epimerase [unclassified Actinobaculum]AWE42036.1 NAD(P)H-hydrate epimerase [Actinobaculum sp. 313]RTE50586.1 NAD(P)H-hydrate epimerase [Actinobaculum sp. 352]
MKRAYRCDDIREAEAPLLEAGVPLMQQAAAALASETLREWRSRGNRIPGTRVLLLVGAGNNGGDALYAGARLARRGMAVMALLASSHVHPEGLAAAQQAGVRVVDGLPSADVVIDGLVGIGARGPLREPLAGVVQALGQRRTELTVAVDVPSGVGGDDGAVSGPVVTADITVTMGALKPGLLLDPGRRHVGRIIRVPLGFEAHLPSEPAAITLEAPEIARLWRVPDADSHKYSRGVAGLMTGSPRYPGAGLLSVDAALASGCGMVRYVGQRELAGVVVQRCPEVVTAPGRVQTWVLGSGIDMDDEVAASEVARRLHEAVAEELPVVLDAGAISLAYTTDLPENVVLTPHAGELVALLAARGEHLSRHDVETGPARAARLAATLTGATVHLKGAIDVACSPDGPLYVQSNAPAWRGTAGAGDVQAGLLGGLLAQWGRAAAHPARLAAAAAAIHARAAAIASGTDAGGVGRPIRAGEIVRAIPAAIAETFAEA